MFYLPFDIPTSEAKINFRDNIFLIGSCFSTEIGERFRQNKFSQINNPFGTIYNPISIFKILAGGLKPDNLVESHKVFYHWDCHGEVSGLNPSQTSEKVEEIQNQVTKYISQTQWLIITLGTAFVYRHNPSGEIVANCHKVPSKVFNKELLSVDKIREAFADTYRSLQERNKALKIIFTVSPVRHIRDGLVENNLSKSILLQAAHKIVADHSEITYFPSYEIIVDQLRDYRFYKSDFVHPTEEATEYVWKQFTQTYFDTETCSFLEKWTKIRAALNHKPFQVESASHQQFLKETIQKLEELKDVVDIRMEKESLENQLTEE